jgi:DtxR family Mn-dependent transcriptional regulator
MLHKSEEDYIKYIYDASTDIKTHLSLKDIASYFSYSEQSVNEMVKKLHKKGYVKYLPYQGVKLLKKGEREAIRMIRSHRIWEVFLEKYLGYSWDEVHQEAEHLEHAGSEKMIEKMYDFIGRPETCQHGNPIPSYDIPFKTKSYPSLYDMEEGDTFQIFQVKDDVELLQYLKHHHIQIHDEMIVLKKYATLSQIEVKHNNHIYHISDQTTKMIFGKKA